MRHRAPGPTRRFLAAVTRHIHRPTAMPLAGHPDRAVIYVLSTALVLLLGTAGVQQLGTNEDVGRLASVNRPLATERSTPQVSRSAARPEASSAASPGTPGQPGATAGSSEPESPAHPTSPASPTATAPAEGPVSPTGPAGSGTTDASTPSGSTPSGSESQEPSQQPSDPESQEPSQEPADNQPPQTTIVSGPTNNSESRFEFDASEAATFSCSLDDGAYQPCDSDEEFEGLGPGRHTLAVRATDLDGNTDPSPARWEWQTNGR